jgi:16S rRNA (uracil1498-N3)-methyltransferase
VRKRFFVKQFSGDRAVIEGETAHHIGRVLRARAGQFYELSDGERVWLARIERVRHDHVEFSLAEELVAYRPTIDVTLMLAIVKFDAFEWVIEKATELGVATIVPLAAARSDKALLAAAGKRAERWRKILLEASQQSRRVRAPILESVRRPEEAFHGFPDGIRLLLSERADAVFLRTLLSGASASRVAIGIGPEGGWTDEELAAGRAAGFWEASLGKLILRTETAVIATLACLNYALGSQ